MKEATGRPAGLALAWIEVKREGDALDRSGRGRCHQGRSGGLPAVALLVAANSGAITTAGSLFTLRSHRSLGLCWRANDDRQSLKNGPQAIGKSRGGWSTKVHMVAADDRTAVTFSLSPGQCGDAPEGRDDSIPKKAEEI